MEIRRRVTRAPSGLSCSLFAIREHIPRRIFGSHGWFQTQGNFPWLDTCLRSLFAGSRRRQPAVNSVSGQVCCPREHSRKGSEHRIGAVCSSDDPLLGPFYGLCHCANLYQCLRAVPLSNLYVSSRPRPREQPFLEKKKTSPKLRWQRECGKHVGSRG